MMMMMRATTQTYSTPCRKCVEGWWSTRQVVHQGRSSRQRTTTTRPRVDHLTTRARTTTATVAGGSHQQERAALESRRVVGILAHVDSGKTTLTEQMLASSGACKRAGRVDTGTTVTDFLELERARGITIQSAAVELKWRETEVCLVDTPGHVDFGHEVDRSVRVLDGAVIVVDAVAGCQARTATVARAAKERGCRTVFVVNKMDRPGADFDKAVASIRRRCSDRLVVTQAPEFDGGGVFVGVDPYIDAEAATATLADVDEEAAEAFLTDHVLDQDRVKAALRRAVLDHDYSPVLCSAALKGVGIDGVLDAITDYLPSPKDALTIRRREASSAWSSSTEENSSSERENSRSSEEDDSQFSETPTKMLAFKVSEDPHRGPLVWLRVAMGRFDSSSKSSLVNLSNEKIERPHRMFRPFADELAEVKVADLGDIVVVQGLRSTKTGDTLTPVSASSKRTRRCKKVTPLEPIAPPPAVFSRSVEPERASDFDALKAALALLERDDPSLRLETSEDDSVLVLAGLGELHLEVARHRLEADFGIQCHFGPPAVELRESVAVSAEHESMFVLDTQLGAKRLKAGIKLAVLPRGSQALSDHLLSPPTTTNASSSSSKNKPSSSKSSSSSLNGDSSSFGRPAAVTLAESVRAKVLGAPKPDLVEQALLQGLEAAARRGPVRGLPLADVDLEVRDLDADPDALDPAALRACAVRALDDILRRANPHLLEPVMRLDLSVDQAKLGDVLADLALKRGAAVLDVAPPTTTNVCAVAAHVPLAELLGYASAVRSLTAGEASFSTDYAHHAPLAKKG